MSSIKFLSSVLCEEVRREDNGRAILIGANMTGPSLSDEKETKVSRLGFFLEAEMVDVDEIWFRLIGASNDDKPIEVDMDFRPMKETVRREGGQLPPQGATIAAALVLNNEDVTFKNSGDYDLQYRIENSEWQTIRTFTFPTLPAE